MKTREFDFDTTTNVLPGDPNETRGKGRESGRMVVLDRSASTIQHTTFTTINEYLRPGDLLVLNDSYVVPDSLWFHCGAEKTQVTICGHEPDGTTIVEIVAKDLSVQPETTLTSIDNKLLSCVLIERVPFRLWKVSFTPFDQLLPTLEQHGKRLHLNQKKWEQNPNAYRSVYAKSPGSLEIPSAGLHFSEQLLSQAIANGVEIAYITLHVGATEILSVRHITQKEIEDHKVRSEYFEVGEHVATQINSAMAEKRRIVAVGTTVMRTLESLARDQAGKDVTPQSGWTDLYIFPGFNFKVVDVLLTNLHRPRSSHIVLTAAFAGKELVMRSYDEITKQEGYEFDMFGDSMLIV